MGHSTTGTGRGLGVLATLGVMWAMAGEAHARTVDPPPEPPERPSNTEKSIGQVLTVAGGIPLVVGVAGMWAAAVNPRPNCEPVLSVCEGPGPLLPYSAILAGAGAAVALPGIALWVHGRRREKKAALSGDLGVLWGDGSAPLGAPTAEWRPVTPVGVELRLHGRW